MPDNTPTTESKPAVADLEAFDLEGFIAGTVRPSKVVPIAQDRTLGEQLLEAGQAVLALMRDQETAKAEGRPSKRRAASTETPELEAARAHVADLTARAHGTFVFVRVEGVSPDQRNAAIDAAKNGNDVDQHEYNRQVLARTSVLYRADPRESPDAPPKKLTAEEWRDLGEAIGWKQYDTILDTLIEVSSTGLMPDFSLPVSLYPGGGESAKS